MNKKQFATYKKADLIQLVLRLDTDLDEASMAGHNKRTLVDFAYSVVKERAKDFGIKEKGLTLVEVLQGIEESEKQEKDHFGTSVVIENEQIEGYDGIVGDEKVKNFPIGTPGSLVENDDGEVAAMSLAPVVLAKKIYRNTQSLQNNKRVWGQLPHYAQTTLIGAKTITGQLLGQSDTRGPVSLARFSGNRKSLFASVTVHGRPVIPGNHKDTDPPVPILLPGVTMEQATSSGDIDMDFLGLDSQSYDEVVEQEKLTIEDFLRFVWEDIRRVRQSHDWMKYLYDFSRKAFQGAQIAAGQLLGFSDKQGPITLQRYIKSGTLDPRVYNALGLPSVKKKTR